MHRTPARRASVLVAAVSSLSLLTAGCGDGDGSADDDVATSGKNAEASPNAPTRTGMTISFLPKQVDTPYFDMADAGGERAVKELGSTFKEVGTEQSADASEQVAHVNRLTEQKVDAIAVSALDPDALCGPLKKAMDAGIKVVTFDSDTKPECRYAFVSPASAEDIAVRQLELLGEQVGYEGDVAILSAAETATSQNAWIAGIKTEMQDARYKDMRLVDVVHGDDEADKSYAKAEELTQKYPKLKGILSPTTNGLKAAAKYLSQSEFKGDVKLTGLGAPNDMRPYIEDGTVEEFVLWDPDKLGELTGYAAVALASAQITGREGQMFLAGDMGWYQISQNGVIALGEPTVFNAGNIDDYDF
ncbi:rhamnose ABC transporter substrate-binding protein [Streptomyces olivaceus]|uniref:rhamnose ABC transporter substrate-binding protein n=1 Tax=Streptomyces olivaceus TaxID=47716 RepID=UPI0008782819|nr:rhamnose ABC transporter substrate-binding protein [Streptomyces olivaceus]AOW90707.1 rhamnose ABC transporter substrate-binding protein [Streptomyces olivaceus]MBZ6308496.1 rhamnose ABC transporter substrate-binding protein [Streptomyces olivaceus]MBZ6322260.1 rhamnose ABC transporter substrate-binding protein [Streptomyces olivaceus]